jgi:two-component system, OmpR family, phosphate regulon sensor histidine kinase PhoR
VKGFGLGLSYVRTMMTAHKGTIEVKSELQKGSSFILFFPFKVIPIRDI